MSAAIPFIGPVVSLLGSFMGGSQKEPKAPQMAPQPAPPPTPAPVPTVKPEDTINAEQDRIRSLKRRRGEYKPLASLSTNTSTKSLLGE